MSDVGTVGFRRAVSITGGLPPYPGRGPRSSRASAGRPPNAGDCILTFLKRTAEARDHNNPILIRSNNESSITNRGNEGDRYFTSF